MATIPKEVEESTRDRRGCGRIQELFSIIRTFHPGCPLAIYNMGLSMWNEFAFANTLRAATSKTLPLALGQFRGIPGYPDYSFRAGIGSVLPMIILFICFPG